ncbi:hypothetical protein RJ53_01855 [Methanocalculus chunghsingensis]|uniref:AraC effector-binding domain-containing protein n=1 Tax=Methanocalculus chunghsingensis TaxID=156457 RepID=A0A8J8B435_9EURY|nr:GyrI-like domain-containing protein [Methanocalculus chunghsingensis]MBR1368306.1 hypothetical protein [Methanocalculus chunghsingensis]
MRLIIEVEGAPQKVLGLRRTGSYDEIGPMIKEIASYIQEKGITPLGPPAYICHEMTLEAVQAAAGTGSADIEVVFPVDDGIEGMGDIQAYELPGGRMVRIIHMGAYRDSGETYTELYNWLAENNLSVNGPIREVYMNDPETTEEDLLVTWIYAPVG